ncbi:hypothetical protein NQ317_009201 [Molorchus minor]|uniref:Uncharacterized protein n=1 Tax=Molorchus minor TaxID=1323400 RepID=A0ABQ9JDB6_9CUCU|nr:hypothetical protein NQ317_009201 [Molorchus minor]
MSFLRSRRCLFTARSIFSSRNRIFSTDTVDEKPVEVKPGGYAQAFKKFENIGRKSLLKNHKPLHHC